MDWSAWLWEVEIGLVLLAVILIDRCGWKLTVPDRKIMYLGIVLIALFVFGWSMVFANRGFWMPTYNIENTTEYRVAGELGKFVKPDETVFLSGTTAFWLNSLENVKQVRGGRDEVSVNDDWRGLVWEVRMGQDGKKAVGKLKSLGVEYLVVHTDYSAEYYHDFENPEKFEGLDLLTKVDDKDGDIIFRLK